MINTSIAYPFLIHGFVDTSQVYRDMHRDSEPYYVNKN